MARGLARRLTPTLLALAFAGAAWAQSADEPRLSLSPVRVLHAGEPAQVHLHLEGVERAEVELRGPGGAVFEILEAGDHELAIEEWRVGAGRTTITARLGALEAQTELHAVAGWWSVIPPILAIGAALLLREVVVSLFLGVFAGALLLNSFLPHIAFARTFDQFVTPAVADSGHASLLVFTLLLGGMVGIVTRNGGAQGIAESFRRLATTTRRAQLSSWLMGMAIFFDDYANTLIVGSTSRPITDKLRISREKLAYIVDSTAAPVASLFPISSWVGYEVGLIAAALTSVGLDSEYNAYGTFVGSIAYRFYPIFALVFVFLVGWTGRDFGPMLAAERRARTLGQVLAPDAKPLSDVEADELQPPPGVVPRGRNALLPIATVVAVTILGLFVTGQAPEGATGITWLREVLGSADSFAGLLWGSGAGVLVALILSATQPALGLKGSIEAMVAGFRSMILALVVLVLAWSLGAVCAEIRTADFLVQATSGVLSAVWLPALIFVLSAAIAFATGTSWATMAILFPLAIPILDQLLRNAGHLPGSAHYTTLLYGTVSSVLAGSVWGDHCSPISDTTILSSTASGCDHLAHVRTQAPYALLLGALGLVVGDIPTAFGVPVGVSLLLGLGALLLIVRFVAKPVEEPGDATAAVADT